MTGLQFATATEMEPPKSCRCFVHYYIPLEPEVVLVIDFKGTNNAGTTFANIDFYEKNCKDVVWPLGKEMRMSLSVQRALCRFLLLAADIFYNGVQHSVLHCLVARVINYVHEKGSRVCEVVLYEPDLTTCPF